MTEMNQVPAQEQGVIILRQIPVIEEHLLALKNQVQEKVEAAQALVCTEETVQTVKKTRAELNHEFADLEAQRKALKKAILGPYEEFERVYKECVSGPFNQADLDLRQKVSQVENEQKAECAKKLHSYFTELCQAKGVEFLTFDQANITIDMASAKAKTPKKLMEQIERFVTNVSDGMAVISGMNNAEEIIVEFKKSWNAAEAVKIVADRHERMNRERAALAAQAAEKAAREADLERVRESAKKYPSQVPVPIQTPVEESVESPRDEKILRAQFTVMGTRSQLLKLRDFMKQEGIKFE